MVNLKQAYLVLAGILVLGITACNKPEPEVDNSLRSTVLPRDIIQVSEIKEAHLIEPEYDLEKVRAFKEKAFKEKDVEIEYNGEVEGLNSFIDKKDGSHVLIGDFGYVKTTQSKDDDNLYVERVVIFIKEDIPKDKPAPGFFPPDTDWLQPNPDSRTEFRKKGVYKVEPQDGVSGFGGVYVM